MEEINNFYDFIQWCFRGFWPTVITISMLSGLGSFILYSIRELRRPRKPRKIK